jgi:hypothetical protein
LAFFDPVLLTGQASLSRDRKSESTHRDEVSFASNDVDGKVSFSILSSNSQKASKPNAESESSASFPAQERRDRKTNTNNPTIK